MGKCECKNWTLKELSEALVAGKYGNKQIVVPTFQRGIRWSKEQQQMLIDSLKNGYPVGTMLFHKTDINGQEVYKLVDGLQRSTTVKNYVNNPIEFFKVEDITDVFVKNVCDALKIGFSTDNKDKIIAIIKNGVYSSKTIDKIKWTTIATQIAKAFLSHDPQKAFDSVEDIDTALEPFKNDLQDKFDEVLCMEIPVIVYSGDEDSLATIFERINSQGTALTTYDIYAASWPSDKQIVVENSNVVLKVMEKYDGMVNKGYTISNYDHNAMWQSKQVTPFEYLFGLSRLINDTYPELKFESSNESDIIIKTGFELVNACLCDSQNNIKTLYKVLGVIDVNKFEKALFEAIGYVRDVIAAVTKFKGNSRNSNGGDKKMLHTKFQIISLVSFAFRKMFNKDVGFDTKRASWNTEKDTLSKCMLQHYIFDIIARNWAEGGHVQAHSRNDDIYYMNPISKAKWDAQLENYLQSSMSRREKVLVASASNEDIVFLNSIYMNKFTAADQLGGKKYDLEHLATKKLMKSLIQTVNSDGLAISCVANTCYLPEDVNRGKREKTLYQFEDLTNDPLKLSEYETKYSFTTRDDLKWVEENYQSTDAQKLQHNYEEYLKNRFSKMKEEFYTSLGIV